MPPLEGTSPVALARVQNQARIQLLGRRSGRPEHELLPVEPERGLATLPLPAAGDLFFDMEGDPYAFDDGLDYLFGVMEGDGTWHAFWSFDEGGEISLAGEKRAFEAFIDFVMARLEADPQLHVYHYAPYEPTAMKRLMGRHATREDQVDRLLRGGVFVDLLRAVRQGVRASVESYSIKRMERFYGFTREIDLRDAGSSIVAFEEWLQLGEGDRPSSDILERIEHYNRDDVVSNARLRDWLEGLRGELAATSGEEVPRPAPRSPDAPEGLTEAGARVQALADRLTDGVPADPAERTEAQAASWLLAQLLSWHRREMKAAYWDFFRRMGLTPQELVQESEALGDLEAAGPQGPASRRTPRSAIRRTWRYHMPAQEHDIGSRAELYDPALQQERPDAKWTDWKLKAQIVAIDDAAGTIDLSWPGEEEPRHPRAIVPLDTISDTDQRAAIFRLGEWVADHGLEGPGAWRAARDLLLRRAPRCGQHRGGRAPPPGRIGPGGCPPTRELPRPGHARDPGSTRIGQDVHRGTHDRSAAERGKAGRHQRDQPQGHREFPEARRGGHDGGACRTASDPEGERRGSGLRRPPCDAYRGQRERPRRHRDRGVQPGSGHRMVLGVGAQRPPRRRPVRRRGGPGGARQRSGDVGRGELHRPPGRSAAARPAPAGLASAGSRSLGAWPTSSGSTPPCLRTAASFSNEPGASTPTCARFTSESFYDDRLVPQPDLVRQRLQCPLASATGPAADGRAGS